ncbi:hypothetical protein C1H76_0608 [Elsinoe australis]|uniref:Protein kinase domain-containing protein n=1 Tax=Elsinoe australis TaxID=40998 RepID=A0A4U7BET1_9PEZI|nr:hypothetical protein C1H76_0608 [Elsinoe australis]
MSSPSDCEVETAESGQPSPTMEHIVFETTLSRHKSSHVFRVSIDGQTYLLKVYRKRIRRHYDHSDREIDPFTCESSAYRRLAEGGLCDEGIVPRFYGIITDINPSHIPHLSAFTNDGHPVNAILLEYVSGLRPFDFTMFNKQRMDGFYAALHKIHRLGILHGDIELRHMQMQPSSGRILWIDFDHAQTFVPDSIPSDWLRRFEDEKRYLDCFMEDLDLDCQEGHGNRTQKWL